MFYNVKCLTKERKDMKNLGTILIGSDGCGKSLIANTIGKILGSDKVKYFTGRNGWKENSFMFSTCKRNTKCIVIDDINVVKDLNAFLSYTQGIQVNKQCENSFLISPYIILIFDSNITKNHLIEEYKLVERRFEIIDLTQVQS